MIEKTFKVCLVLFLLVIVSSCTTKPILNYKNERLPTKFDGSAYTQEQVRDAIMEACQKLGWVGQVREEGIIDASIRIRSYRAEIEIQYDKREISILYKNSKGLSYFHGSIHHNYNRWVANLRKTILKCLPRKSSY